VKNRNERIRKQAASPTLGVLAKRSRMEGSKSSSLHETRQRAELQQMHSATLSRNEIQSKENLPRGETSILELKVENLQPRLNQNENAATQVSISPLYKNRGVISISKTKIREFESPSILKPDFQVNKQTGVESLSGEESRILVSKKSSKLV
jgi:hypothetical protein